jgi:hypothetical protein
MGGRRETGLHKKLQLENTVLSCCRGALPLSCLANSLGGDHIENTSSTVLLCCPATDRYVTIIKKYVPTEQKANFVSIMKSSVLMKVQGNNSSHMKYQYAL